MKIRSNIIMAVLAACLLFSGCGSKIKDGVEALNAGDYTKAEQLFQESVDKGKDLDEAYMGLGVCYWEDADYQKALENFEKAIDAGAKKNAALYNMMGISGLKTDEFEKAADYFKAGLKSEEMSEELTKEMSFNLIAAYEGMQEFDKASEHLEEYLKQYPDDEKALKEQEFFNTQLK